MDGGKRCVRSSGIDGSNFFRLCWFAGAARLCRDLSNKGLTIPCGDFYDRADYGSAVDTIEQFRRAVFFLHSHAEDFLNILRHGSRPTQSTLAHAPCRWRRSKLALGT